MKSGVRVLAAGIVAVGLCGIAAQAQAKHENAAAGDTAGKSMDEIVSIYEGQIVPAAEAMPADKFNFSPTAATFAAGSKADFTSPKPVMTFAEEVRHLAQANYHFYTIGSGMKADRDVKAIGDLKDRDEIIKALKDSFAFAHKAVGSMTAANAFGEVAMGDHKTTPAATYAFALAHMGDHYGQMVEYLRMNGIVPPASRPHKSKGD